MVSLTQRLFITTCLLGSPTMLWLTMHPKPIWGLNHETGFMFHQTQNLRYQSLSHWSLPRCPFTSMGWTRLRRLSTPSTKFDPFVTNLVRKDWPTFPQESLLFFGNSMFAFLCSWPLQEESPWLWSSWPSLSFSWTQLLLSSSRVYWSASQLKSTESWAFLTFDCLQFLSSSWLFALELELDSLYLSLWCLAKLTGRTGVPGWLLLLIQWALLCFTE